MKKIPGTKRDYFKELNLKDHNIKEIFNIANDTRKSWVWSVDTESVLYLTIAKNWNIRNV